MSGITITPLSADLAFGARITGVDLGNVQDAEVRRQISEVYLDRGLIVFEVAEPSGHLQVALSKVFGPLQDHELRSVPRADDRTLGLVELSFHPDTSDIWEVDGRQLGSHVIWHFDACYNETLNRGGILRALEIPPQGGNTLFADGIQLYDAISPDLRDAFEGLDILYDSQLVYTKMRFGKPRSLRPIRVSPLTEKMFEERRGSGRSVHPAVWQRPTGEKVLHVSPWQAAGIAGREGPADDALLEELFDEIFAKMTPYRHSWKLGDMVIWDNWRFIHAASGHDPRHARTMQRTTICGDYGLGRRENREPAACEGAA